MRKIVTSFAIAALAATTAAEAQERNASGTLADGTEWSATVPDGWNGTLLVYGHGYSFKRGPAEEAPAQHRAELLRQGYALAAANYGPGWALDSAIPDQIETVDAFAAKFGKPKRTIAYGMSMGALVTSGMVERPGNGLDGGIAFCGSIGGAVGMMNMALDGAYAFRTLLAPQSEIRLVGVDDDRVNGQRVADVLAEAQKSPAGRARVTLAGVLAGIPGWTGGERPAEGDYDAQAAQIAKTFVMGVFLPRTDQEKRAGGVFSWNTGVAYGAQLAKSGRAEMVRALYRAAGLDLEADLATLDAGKRIAADPAAVQWMTANYTPNAKPLVPMLAVQNVGDGMTSPSLQQAWLDAASRHAGGRNAQGLWLAAPGHCSFDTATVVDAIHVLEGRIASGKWPAAPARFVAYTPPPMLRPCVRGEKCR